MFDSVEPSIVSIKENPIRQSNHNGIKFLPYDPVGIIDYHFIKNIELTVTV